MQLLHQVPLHRISCALSRYASSECPDDRLNVITAALLPQRRVLKKFLAPGESAGRQRARKTTSLNRGLHCTSGIMNSDREIIVILNVFARRDRDADLPDADHRAFVAPLLFQ